MTYSSLPDLAKLWSISPNAIPTPLELDCFHTWLDLEYFCIPAPVCFTAKPVSLDKCKQIFKRFNVLFVSSEHNEPNTRLFTKVQNLRFRALHDWHHIQANADATLTGEVIAFYEARKTAPAFIHWILFSEIVLQAAVAIHTGSFPEQKLVKHPELCRTYQFTGNRGAK